MKKLIFFLFLSISQITFAQQKSTLPKGLVYLTDYIPHIALDLKYFTNHNFVGKQIDGYKANKVILTQRATLAIQKIEKELNKEGLGLKVFDAYRPQTAVNHFKRWAKDVKDTLMRQEFYPQVDKRDLFKKGFIASKSGHSRGSTIDLTIIDLKTKKELDMGVAFDFFGEESGHGYQKLHTTQKQNRIKLKKIMEKYGFRAYSKEWWHYTLNNEPFKDKYFDFHIN
ncbi:M15 family metallopeptidase [Sphingobacterium bovistauri]|uniref:D-alanyl-D-alanine dipeptidase n=1 Tax=Sphingobacterium bovistauri TaxID=2781959 RepID=A0ABS7Z334_9SPHI|nr:M15 family metallopeptidase [Sphingobacterium bovistauri]MCA5004605.1 M15 family metallopeptidase [Sphingobacterium bovistauri]